MDRTRDFDNKPIPRLLFQMSLPSVICMMVQSIYNFCDSAYLSHMDQLALTSLSIALPIQLIQGAISVGFGIGINSCISRLRGEKQLKKAEQTATHGIIMGIMICIAFAAIGGTLCGPFVNQYSDNPLVQQYGVQYLTICCVFSFGAILSQITVSILQSHGDMIRPMIGLLVGMVLNIILDPILIFGYLGMPALGVSGAAIATVISQIVTMTLVLYFAFSRKKGFMRLKLRGFNFDFALSKEILKVGIPAMIMQIITSVTAIITNKLLAFFGDDVMIGAYGVYWRVQALIFMPVFGIGRGALPILGYTYGQKNKKRFRDALKYSILYAEIFMVIGVILFQFFPETIFHIMGADDTLTEIGSRCFRILSITFVAAGVSIPLANTFSATGKSYLSMFSYFIRQILLLIPLCWLFAHLWGAGYFWYGFLIADMVNLIFTIYVYHRLKKNELSTWPDILERREQYVH